MKIWIIAWLGFTSLLHAADGNTTTALKEIEHKKSVEKEQEPYPKKFDALRIDVSQCTRELDELSALHKHDREYSPIEEMMKCARDNDVEGLEWWVTQENAYLNTCNEEYESPLIVATRWNNKEAVEWLLRKGCNRDFYNIIGETALMVATRHNNKEMVALLCQFGADPGLRIPIPKDPDADPDAHASNIARSAWDMARIFSHTECGVAMMRFNPLAILMQEMRERNIDGMRDILKHCTVDINKVVCDRTLLGIALEWDDGDAIQLLLSHGANPLLLMPNRGRTHIEQAERLVQNKLLKPEHAKLIYAAAAQYKEPQKKPTS